MFGSLFRRRKQPQPILVIARLNARLSPLDRGEIFEDPLDAVLRARGVGEVTGGGSQLSELGEIEYCELEISLTETSPELVQLITDTLQKLGAPKGSVLRTADGAEVGFGTAEGLAVYLNGTDLPDEVYAQSDANFVYSEFGRLLGDSGRVLSHWQGPRETALYMYGPSAERMAALLADFIASYPLCSQSRTLRVA